MTLFANFLPDSLRKAFPTEAKIEEAYLSVLQAEYSIIFLRTNLPLTLSPPRHALHE